MPIINKRTGTKGRRAITDFQKSITNIGKKAAKALPTTFYPRMAAQVRAGFKENYLMQEGWQYHTFKNRDYPVKKDLWKAQGDSFSIKSLGTRTIKHGSEMFGRRSDFIFDNIGSKNATSVRTRVTDVAGGRRNFTFIVALRPELWDGGTTHHHTRKDGTKTSYRSKYNALEMFSKQVSPPGEKSVFVKQTSFQLSWMKRYIRDNFKVAVNKVMQRREGI